MEEIKILIIEDDESINNLLKDILRRESYKVTQAFSGTEARLVLGMEKFDLIILDLMLPGISGEELVGLIRDKSTVPLIVISAKLDLDTRVELLGLGADDFIVKPFENKELVARVKAQLRRSLNYSEAKTRSLVHKNLEIIDEERRLLVKGQELRLTATEYDILKLFLENPKKVFTKSNIYNSIWGENSFMDENTINVHISNIRSKIGRIDEEDYIETVWGIGFKLK